MPSRKKSIILWIIAGIVILGLVVVEAFVAEYQRGIQSVKPLHALHPELATAIALTTYSNKEFGFSIDYPADSTFAEQRKAGFGEFEPPLFDIKFSKQISNLKPTQNKNLFLTVHVTPGISLGGANRALYETLKNPINHLQAMFVFSESLVVYVAPLPIAGSTAYTSVSSSGGVLKNGEIFQKNFEIVHNGKLYAFDFGAVADDTINESVGLFDKIIGTLHFTDSQ